jgi:hypothetical protein
MATWSSSLFDCYDLVDLVRKNVRALDLTIPSVCRISSLCTGIRHPLARDRTLA